MYVSVFTSVSRDPAAPAPGYPHLDTIQHLDHTGVAEGAPSFYGVAREGEKRSLILAAGGVELEGEDGAGCGGGLLRAVVEGPDAEVVDAVVERVGKGRAFGDR